MAKFLSEKGLRYFYSLLKLKYSLGDYITQGVIDDIVDEKYTSTIMEEVALCTSNGDILTTSEGTDIISSVNFINIRY